MGFFEDVGNFFAPVGQFFQHPIDTISNTVSDVFHTIDQNVISPIKDTVGGIIGTVHDDVKGLVGGVKDTASSIINTVGGLGNNLIDKAGDTVSNLGQSLSMPLLVVGAGVLLFVLMNKK